MFAAPPVGVAGRGVWFKRRAWTGFAALGVGWQAVWSGKIVIERSCDGIRRFVRAAGCSARVLVAADTMRWVNARG